MSLSRLVQLVRDREAVKSGVVNRPIRQNAANIDFLWQVLQETEAGSTVYAYLQTVEAEAVVGQAVYLNVARQRFERGLAVMDSTPGLGLPVIAEKGKVWGIIARKRSSTTADILLYGFATIDISAAVDGTVEAGDYFLSGTTPGKLVKQRLPISIPVLRSNGNGQVYVLPQFIDFLDRHVHYRFDLICRPAGVTTPPALGERHVITDADSSVPGWLPAEHAVFAGKAPQGAAFGYNFSQHSELDNAWPPLPDNQAIVEWDKGIDKDVGFTGVPQGVDGLCVIDANGIWWMSDAYGDVPWPVSFDTETYTSDSISSSVSIESPRDLHMAMRIFFCKLQFATDNTVVTSLESADQLLTITCLDGVTPAKAGALKIKLNLNLAVEDGSRLYTFLTGLNGNKLTRGLGARGLYAASDNVSLTGDATSLLDPEDENSAAVYHGNVGVSVSLQPTYEVPTTLIRVDGVDEGHYEDMMYLAFVASRQSEYRGRIDVPHDLQLPSPQLQLRLRVLGTVSGTLPALEFTARRVPASELDGDGNPIPQVMPDSGDEFTVTLDTASVLDDNYQYVDLISDAFEVAAGDQVFYTVRRLSTDGYAGEVGIWEQKGVLSSSA